MATHSGIRDDGLRFQIVPSTRKITVPASHKVIGTVGDHMSEQITIMCPLTIDGHDITGCARKFITWKNVSGDVGHDELVVIENDEEYIYFTWTIRDGLTVVSGMVQFSIHFEDTDDSGVVLYRWSTAPCTECEILDSVNALLGTYQAIYVAGNTLVIADYNPVEDKTLSLDSAGIIPSGTLDINTVGKHAVGEFAEVNVTVPGLYEEPTIEVDWENSVITAVANGVESTRQVVDYPMATLTLTFSSYNENRGRVYVTTQQVNGMRFTGASEDLYVAPNSTHTLNVPLGSMVVIQGLGLASLDPYNTSGCVEVGYANNYSVILLINSTEASASLAVTTI